MDRENLLGYISGRVGLPPATYEVPIEPGSSPEAASGSTEQQLLNEAVAIDNRMFHKLLALNEMVDQLGYVASPTLIAAAEELTARYNARQEELKDGSLIKRFQRGYIDAWDWLAQKWANLTDGIGVVPVVAVAIVLAIAAAGSYVITRLTEIIVEANADEKLADGLLSGLLNHPDIKAEDIANLLGSLAAKTSGGSSDFVDDLLGGLGKLVVGGAAIFLAVKYLPPLLNKQKA